MFHLWPLMTLLIVILMVLVGAPIKKNVIFLLVGTHSCSCSSVAQMVQEREGLCLLSMGGPALVGSAPKPGPNGDMGVAASESWLSSLVEILECLSPEV